LYVMILSYRTRRRISSSPGAHFPAFFRTPCRTHCLLVPSLPSPFVTQPPRKFDPFRFPGSSLPFRHQGTGRSLPQPYPLSAPSGALIDVDVLLPRDLSPYGQFEDQNRRATCEAWDVPPIMVHTSPIMKSPLLAIRPLYPAVRRQGIRITPAKLQDRIQEGTKDNKRLFFFFFFFSYLTCGSRWRRSGQIGALSTYIGVEGCALRFRLFASYRRRAIGFSEDRAAGSGRLDSNVQSWQEPPHR
jgi:hypothetical protein